MHLLILLAVVFFGGDIVSAQDSAAIQKCPLQNTTCQSETIVQLARIALANGGFQQFNIASIDPQYLNPTSQQVMDFIKLTLHAGECLQIIHTCRIRTFEMDLVNMRRRLDTNCKNIIIQGIYSLETHPAFTHLFGDITGCGNFTIVLEDWSFYFDYEFGFEKRDGDIFLTLNDRDGIYNSTVETKATFKADLIKSNSRNITKKVLAFMNKYWKYIVEVFGEFIKQQGKLYYDLAYGNLFSHLPATALYTDDLEQYVKNDCSQSKHAA